MWLALWLACSPAPVPDVTFVRGGVLVPGASGGRAVGGGRSLVDVAWKPGDVQSGAVAPERPECVALFSVALGDVSAAIAAGAEPPDTAIAFSPDGARVAIGAYTGEVVVADGFTGAVLARRSLPEALAKRVAWSPDGAVLYVGEQSPDARLYALDAATLADRWVAVLADDVGHSPAPAGDDVYGVYQLPGVFGLAVTPDGDVLAVAVHGWNDAALGYRNASRVYRFGPDGARKAAWPAAGVADATLMTLAWDREGGALAVPVGRSAAGPAPADLPVGGVVVLDAATLAPRATFALEPLGPWFDRVFIWDALGVSVAADRVVVGTGDGRVRAWRLSDGVVAADLAPGVPIDAGGVPLAASVGFAALVGDEILALTSGTSIPFGAADPALRPPRAHPGENTIGAWSRDGAPRWTFHGPERLAGLAISPDRGTLVAGAGLRDVDVRTDLFGALVFRLGGAGAGAERLVTTCPTEGPVFFRMAVADDGRIAVAEHPWRRGDVVTGQYRVTVLR